MVDSQKKSQADAQFKKAQRALDGKQAMSEYEANAAAVRSNTEKLRAARLARDAAIAAAAPAITPAKKRGKKAKAKVAGPSLSDWLKERNDSGHSN